jgi:hypothetical protein
VVRGRSAIVGCLGFLLSCSDEPADSSESGSGVAPSGGAPATGGTNATGGISAPPQSGGSSGSGGEQHPAPGGGGQGGGLTPQPCSLTAPTECPSSDLRYATVEPIFRERCVVCHAGMPGGPWPLNSYGHVASWRDTIRAALLTCAMPPADSGMIIPPEDSRLILEWIRCGMPP